MVMISRSAQKLVEWSKPLQIEQSLSLNSGPYEELRKNVNNVAERYQNERQVTSAQLQEQISSDEYPDPKRSEEDRDIGHDPWTGKWVLTIGMSKISHPKLQATVT